MYLLDPELLVKIESDMTLMKSEELLVERLAPVLKPWLLVKSGGLLPEQGDIEQIWEPIVEVEIV
jgi:hypothetical protein